MEIKSLGGYSIHPHCVHSLTKQRPRLQKVMLQAEKKCGESSRPACSGRADTQAESPRTSSQCNRHNRKGLPRPAEVGHVEASPAVQLPSCSFSAAAPGSCTSRHWTHFCPHPLGPPAGSLLRITMIIPPRPRFEHQTHLMPPLAVSWPRAWPKLIRLDLNIHFHLPSPICPCQVLPVAFPKSI